MLMELDIFGTGKEYISASRAGKLTDYTSDYIGQLCRAGRITGKLIGRTWFVDLEALKLHKKNRKLGKPKNDASQILCSNPDVSYRSTPLKSFSFAYESDERSLLPELSKTGRYVAPVTSIFLVRHSAALSLGFILILSLGLGVLERTSPQVSLGLKDRIETLSSLPQEFVREVPPSIEGTQLAAASLLELFSGAADFFLDGFRNLRDIAMGSFIGSPTFRENSIVTLPPEVPAEQTPPAASIASTQPSP